MREILFKAKRADNGEWVEGDLVRHYENQRRFIACDQMAYTSETVGIKRLVSENSHEVIPETIGQYTGLVDKKGKKIFEGDIVKFGDSVKMDKTGDVKFTAGAFMPVINGIGYTSWHIVCEIIGNIHDKEKQC